MNAMKSWIERYCRQVRELLQANHLSQLDELLNVLKDLTMSPNVHARTGGLIGLAAAAIGLGKVCRLPSLYNSSFSTTPIV